MKPRDFIVQALSLDNLLLDDRAHQALRNHPGDEPPRAFVLQVHPQNRRNSAEDGQDAASYLVYKEQSIKSQESSQKRCTLEQGNC